MKGPGVIIIILSLLASIDVEGQVIGSVGGKAGVSLANQRHQITPIDYTMETDYIVGPGIAFFLEAFRGRHFSFQSDLAFVTKGSKTSTHSVTVNHLENDRIIANKGEPRVSRFHYLSFSPMARYRMSRSKPCPRIGPVRTSSP